MHPSELFTQEEINRVRSQSAQAETEQAITEDVLSLVAEKKWFRILQPKSIGGLELPLPKAVQLFESLAWLDGNLGWIVNVGAGANMFSGYLNEDAAKSIFCSPTVACAGSGAKGGTATQTQGGWTVNARWNLCGGSNHAAYFDGNALLEDENHQPILDDNGEQQFKAFIFPSKEGINHYDWNSTGLKAISANTIEARGVFVPDANVFSTSRPSPHAQGAIYQFPFIAMAYVNMSVNYSGMAIHFEDLCETVSRERTLPGTGTKLCETPNVQDYFMAAKKSFHNARCTFFNALQDWQNPDTQATMIELGKALSRASRDFMSATAPMFGMDLVNPDCEANKVWRDAAACGQHPIMAPW